MRMQKRGCNRGQAATEFLMTYGWTILVIMLVVGLLFGLGVFDLKTPNSCFTPDPYKCLDIKLSEGGTFTALISGSGIDPSPPPVGFPIRNRVTEIKINGQPCTLPGPQVPPPVGSPYFDMSNAEDAAAQPTCTLSPLLSKGSKFEGTIVLIYQKYGGNPHTVNGEFTGTLE